MGAEGLGAIQIDVSVTYLFCSYLPLQYQYSKKKDWATRYAFEIERIRLYLSEREAFFAKY